MENTNKTAEKVETQLSWAKDQLDDLARDLRIAIQDLADDAGRAALVQAPELPSLVWMKMDCSRIQELEVKLNQVRESVRLLTYLARA